MDGVFSSLSTTREIELCDRDGEISDVVHYDFDGDFRGPADLASAWLRAGKRDGE